jgi:hypothetical protein
MNTAKCPHYYILHLSYRNVFDPHSFLSKVHYYCSKATCFLLIHKDNKVSFVCSYILVTFWIHKRQFNLHIYFIQILEKEGLFCYKLRIFTVRLQTVHTEPLMSGYYLRTLIISYITYLIIYFYLTIVSVYQIMQCRRIIVKLH